jgi:arginyl-tRNA--protein-N-Asp/Glu arginylyltransferase
MKLRFSEYRSDYGNYLFPYVVWGFPEPGETAADFFRRGFLPSNRELTRFYMCRQTRVDLRQFEPSSENRRILRKGGAFSHQLISADSFEFTPRWRDFCRSYADKRFGAGIMSDERLDSLFSAPVCSHVMRYRDEQDRDIGLVVYFMQEPQVAFYYYAFYDLALAHRNLGIYMMTSSVGFLKNEGFEHIYLGSCYSRNALYKAQFKGFEFWNGFRWSSDITELKYLLARDSGEVQHHLLDTPEYRAAFYPDGYHD